MTATCWRMTGWCIALSGGVDGVGVPAMAAVACRQVAAAGIMCCAGPVTC